MRHLSDKTIIRAGDRSLSRLIPNRQTRDKLEKSLKGSGQNVKDAVYSIVSENFLIRDAGKMTEEERRETIGLGMAKAEFLADNYIEENRRADFLAAMETAARYGINGRRNGRGIMIYDIRRGPVAGAPDDYVDSLDLMEKIAPDVYRNYRSMMEKGIASKDYKLLSEASGMAVDWEIAAYKDKAEEFRKEAESYVRWKKRIEEIRLDYTDEAAGETVPGDFSKSAAGPAGRQRRRLKELEDFRALLERGLEGDAMGHGEGGVG